MAKNYTFNEAVKIIAKGTDLEAITDIGRRYPVLAHKIAVVTAKAGEEFVDLMGYMPDYLTANKVNTAIKAGITESGSDDEDAEDTEAEATTEDATEATAQWDESMSAKQLWDILGKAGKRKLAKSTKKADLVEACKQAFGAATETEAKDAEAEDNATEVSPLWSSSRSAKLVRLRQLLRSLLSSTLTCLSRTMLQKLRLLKLNLRKMMTGAMKRLKLLRRKIRRPHLRQLLRVVKLRLLRRPKLSLRTTKTGTFNVQSVYESASIDSRKLGMCERHVPSLYLF